MTAAGFRLDAKAEREVQEDARLALLPLDLSKPVIGAWRVSCASEANALWRRRAQAASRGAIDVAPPSSASEDSLGVLA
jgi:hypothetical protein